jgi:O-glycosyl hydrolase
MKTNGNEAGGGYLCGVTTETCSSGDWRQAYANYLVKYIQDYKAAGIDITYVGFLNEPEFA